MITEKRQLIQKFRHTFCLFTYTERNTFIWYCEIYYSLLLLPNAFLKPYG